MRKIDKVREMLVEEFGWTLERINNNIDLVGDSIEASRLIDEKEK